METGLQSTTVCHRPVWSVGTATKAEGQVDRWTTLIRGVHLADPLRERQQKETEYDTKDLARLLFHVCDVCINYLQSSYLATM